MDKTLTFILVIILKSQYRRACFIPVEARGLYEKHPWKHAFHKFFIGHTVSLRKRLV